ncbi:MAG: VacJ family lipoprotein [Pseudomonas sp.]
MKLTRSLALVPLLVLLAACAGQAPKSSAPEPAPVAAAEVAAPAAEPAAAAEPAPAAVAPEATATATTSADDAGTGAPTGAEDDYAALYGGPTPSASAGAAPAAVAYDPWERYNRGVHRFNLVVDKYFAHPVATTYATIVPSVARLGVSNFFDNLKSPVTLVNQLLQGHPVKALQTLGRFALNSTIGFAGLFDPATSVGIPRGSEDFGQTLAVWGWRNSRYFELPFFGPRTLRDTFGLAGDMPLSLLRQIEDDKIRYGLTGLQLVNTRANLLSLDDMRNQAPDEYALVRDAWMQRRDYQIQQDLRHRKGEAEQELPDYMRQDTTVPVEGVPLR